MHEKLVLLIALVQGEWRVGGCRTGKLWKKKASSMLFQGKTCRLSNTWLDCSSVTPKLRFDFAFL